LIVLKKHFAFFPSSIFCEEESPIQSKGLKDPLRTSPGKDLKFFWVELEEGTFHSSINGGDPSQRQLGVTHNGKGCPPSQLTPKKRQKFFWVELEEGKEETPQNGISG